MGVAVRFGDFEGVNGRAARRYHWPVAGGRLVLGFLALAGGLLVLLAAGCGDDDGPPVTVGDVVIVAPPDQAVVHGAFDLLVRSPTYLIADPAKAVPGAAHFAAFVDIRPFTPAGEVIPLDQEGIYHFSSERFRLDLPKGEHRIVVALADNNNVRIADATVTAVTVFVE